MYVSKQIYKPYGVGIFVRSSPNEFDLREAIRKTWKTICDKFKIPVIFFVGLSRDPSINSALYQEEQIFQDLVILKMQDAYRNLTLKQLLIFKWFRDQKFANDVVFVWSSTDVFIYPTSLLSLIYETKVGFNRNQILGKCLCHGRADKECYHTSETANGMYPFRNESHKYFVPRIVWPYKKYPNFCIGFAVILSPNVPELFLQAAETRSFDELDGFFEDVLFLGLFARDLGLQFVNTKAFCEGKTMKNRTDCAVVHARDNQAFTKVNGDLIRGMWHFYQEKMQFTEISSFNSGKNAKNQANMKPVNQKVDFLKRNSCDKNDNNNTCDKSENP